MRHAPPRRFQDAIAAGRVSAVQAIGKCCVLAAVGEGMVNRKGVAATMMSALAKANVNIKAIAQVRRGPCGAVLLPAGAAGCCRVLLPAPAASGGSPPVCLP
jgi:hypothetical protein